MSESHFLVRKVAVLGAGVMGAQIAAHLANASVPVELFDLTAKEGDPNGIAQKAIENLKKLEPSPLATKDRADYIDAANYDQHLALLAGCDLVIEAISERMDWKKALYEKVSPHVSAQAIFASNTSSRNSSAPTSPGIERENPMDMAVTGWTTPLGSNWSEASLQHPQSWLTSGGKYQEWKEKRVDAVEMNLRPPSPSWLKSKKRASKKERLGKKEPTSTPKCGWEEQRRREVLLGLQSDDEEAERSVSRR